MQFLELLPVLLLKRGELVGGHLLKRFGQRDRARIHIFGLCDRRGEVVRREFVARVALEAVQVEVFRLVPLALFAVGISQEVGHLEIVLVSRQEIDPDGHQRRRVSGRLPIDLCHYWKRFRLIQLQRLVELHHCPIVKFALKEFAGSSQGRGQLILIVT